MQTNTDLKLIQKQFMRKENYPFLPLRIINKYNIYLGQLRL